MKANDIITESHQACPHCGGPLMEYSGLMEKKDACYYKVKASAKVWPSAYASGRLVQCRKKGAGNYGNKSESMAEGESNDTAISLSKLGKFHPGADTLAEFVPERATAQYALHPNKWESTFYSLTNKDSDKLKYYGPKKISIPPGTLVGDMAIANKFYRAKTPEEQEQYAELYKASLQPYPVDVSEYRMPELLIPKQGVAEGLEYADKLSGLVDLPVFNSSTNPNPSGVAKVVYSGDRIMAVMNVRGVNVPYYISTGQGGKASVPTGKWYPVFGVHSSGWLNKGGEDSINKFYGSKMLALNAGRLNNALGDLSSVEEQIPLMKKTGFAIINKDLQPMGHAEVSANPDEFKKRVNAFLAKLGSEPFYQVNATQTQGVAEGSEEFNTVKTSPYKATQLLGGKYPVAFAIEVLCPDQSVVSMIQNKIGRAYQVERDNSIEGNGIGIEIVSRRFEGGQTAQAAYDQLLDFIEQNGGQFNSSTQVTIYKQKQGMAEAQLDEKCWDGYQQQGMKNKGNRQVPNCVPVTEDTDPEIEEMYEAMEQLAEEMAATKGVSVDLVWESFEALDDHMLYETAAWRRKEGKSARGGLNAKGVASYRRENPGSKLQTAVTTKPSKLKPGSKAAKRRKSFCARMGGVKGPMKKPNGKPTRKALALRKWNC